MIVLYGEDPHEEEEQEELDVRSTYVDAPPKWFLMGHERRSKNYDKRKLPRGV